MTAGDGASGIQASNRYQNERKEFDCIVTDIQMPEMDGYETAMHLRAQGYNGPILALSASAMEEDRDRAVAAGCNDHCPKPIDKRKLIAKIAELVSGGPNDGET